MAKKRISEGCPVDLTPMIDVVFQLIIFFIVTMTMEKEVNTDIELQPARHGPVPEKNDPTTMIIEVDQRGWISMHGAAVSKSKLRKLLEARYHRYKEFPILIRGDRRTSHAKIREVMDICTECNIWRLDFVAISKYADE